MTLRLKSSPTHPQLSIKPKFAIQLQILETGFMQNLPICFISTRLTSIQTWKYLSEARCLVTDVYCYIHLNLKLIFCLKYIYIYIPIYISDLYLVLLPTSQWDITYLWRYVKIREHICGFGISKRGNWT